MNSLSAGLALPNRGIARGHVEQRKLVMSAVLGSSQEVLTYLMSVARVVVSGVLDPGFVQLVDKGFELVRW